MKVSELARRSGVTAEAIRHYTDKGLLLAKRDPVNGYKIYQTADVGRVRFIRQAKQLGLKLAEIGQVLSHADKGVSPCAGVYDMIQAKIEENRCRLNELEALQIRMKNALNQWCAMPDKVPCGGAFCCLIESVEGIADGV